MNLLKIRYTALPLAGLVALSGCSMNQMVKAAKDQELTVTPSPLELHGDSVKFKLDAVLPTKMLKKNRLYTLRTSYKYSAPQGEEFETVEFSDTEFPNQKVENPSQSSSFSFYYTDDMQNGEVVIKGVASNLEKTKFKETAELSVAKGVIITSRMVQDAYNIAYADHGYDNREELVPTHVEFLFEKGSANLRSSEIKGGEGKKLDAFIASKNKTRTVTIMGSHSPEGLERINEKLSEQRAKVVEDFYRKKMRQYDYRGLADSIKFETKAIIFNWDGFKEALNASDQFTAEEKQQAIQATSQGATFEEQAKSVEQLPFYSRLESEIYPGLRYSKTEILSVKPKKTDAEISILAKGIIDGKSNYDTLSFEELMFAAEMTPLADEKEKLYMAATKYDMWQAYNNLGAIYLEKAQKAGNESDKNALVGKALDQFKLANSKEESAEALNNEAICLLIKGERDAAMEKFNAASSKPSSNPEVKKGIQAGLGTIYVKRGEYPQAISNLGSAGTEVQNAVLDLGLAHLLSKDYPKAEQALSSASYINEQDATAYYLLAVVGARTNNLELMTKNLAQAVKLDRSLAEKAVNDLEFANFQESEEFKNALK